MLTILINYQEAFLNGLLVTCKLILPAILLGIPLGVAWGALASYKFSLLKYLIKALNFILSSIPVLVLLFWFHYPLQNIFQIVVDPFWTAAFVLFLINLIITADLMLRELKLFPKELIQTSKALGLSTFQILTLIELPILIRRILPQLLINLSVILQLSLLASFISVPELFRTAQNINSQIYRPVEIYSLLVLFFIIVLGPINLLSNYLKKKYGIRNH